MHLLRLLFPFFSIFVGVAISVLPALPAYAHDICCDHTHTGAPHNANICEHNSACNQPWDYGSCADKNFQGYQYCSCTLPAPDDDYGLLLVNALASLGGAPAANTTISYQTTTGPDSFGELLYGNQTVVDFPANTTGPGGFLTLTFGSFANPNAVPVTVDSWFFEFAPGTIAGNPTGPSSTQISAGTTPQLVYDSSTGILSTPPGDSMLLDLTNDIHTNAPLRILWTGQVSPSGSVLQVEIQSVASFAPPSPVPSIDARGLFLFIGLVILFGAGAFVSNERWAGRAGD